DAHIQRAVAVDEVVATTAFDEVAAVAAQDDVARAKRAYTRAEEVLETVDERDIGEYTTRGTAMVHDRARVHIVPPQAISEGRARQPFPLGEPIEDRGGRRRHRQGNMVSHLPNTA